MQCAASARITDADDPAAQATPRRTCTGTAEQILDDLAQFAEAGYSMVVCEAASSLVWTRLGAVRTARARGRFRAVLECPSGALSEQLDQIERFGAEVIPEAKKLKPAGEWKPVT